MESDVKQSEQAQLLTKVSSEASYTHCSTCHGFLFTVRVNMWLDDLEYVCETERGRHLFGNCPDCSRCCLCVLQQPALHAWRRWHSHSDMAHKGWQSLYTVSSTYTQYIMWHICRISSLFVPILLSGKIIFFSEGILFIHSQYGSITLSKDHINNVKFYDPVWVLIIWLTENNSSSVIAYYDTVCLYVDWKVWQQPECDLCVLVPNTRTPAPWLLFLWSMRAVCSHTCRSLSTAPTSAWSLLFSPDLRATGPSTPRWEPFLVTEFDRDHLVQLIQT